MIKLTNDSYKMLCMIYKTFLQRRKSNIAKSSARRFAEDYFSTHPKLKDWIPGDISDSLLELGRSGLVKIYIGGNFDLTDAGIIQMENRFKNGLTELTDFLGKFI